MRRWRPRRRSTNSDAGVQRGGGQRATLESKEEEDGGECWRPRRRTEDDARVEEEDSFTGALLDSTVLGEHGNFRQILCTNLFCKMILNLSE